MNTRKDAELEKCSSGSGDQLRQVWTLEDFRAQGHISEAKAELSGG